MPPVEDDTVGREVKVYTVTADKPECVRCSCKWDAETLVLHLCKKLNIKPLAKTLFVLRIRGTKWFIPDNALVLTANGPQHDYEFRIRYKVAKIEHLRTICSVSFNYFYKQTQDDFRNDKIFELECGTRRSEMFGLAVTDMYISILEYNRNLRDVIQDYRSYTSKELLKQHWFFAKYILRRYLNKMYHQVKKDPNMSDILHLKQLYLKQVVNLAPNYLSEEYQVQWKHGQESVPARLQLAPTHHQQPGLRVLLQGEKEWKHLCTIEQLVCVMRQENEHMVEVISQGQPIWCSFHSDSELSSFISGCDGYYRLMVKSTFNLSTADKTPSLDKLREERCHGPVGGMFSYGKLCERSEPGEGGRGTFILRQCELEYDTYYIDVRDTSPQEHDSQLSTNSTAKTYKLVWVPGSEHFKFNDSDDTFPSLRELYAAFDDPAGDIYLRTCIPPSVYDKSKVLLCAEKHRLDAPESSREFEAGSKQNPPCLNNKELSIVMGDVFKNGWFKNSSQNITVIFQAKINSQKVAVKALKAEKKDAFTEMFMELVNNWARIKSDAVVKLQGVLLLKPVALVLEWLPYGPLDLFLSNYAAKIDHIQLLKIGAQLARALYDISEAQIVHGYIRCRKLMVSRAYEEDDKIRGIEVKLADPGLRTLSFDFEAPWIPEELYGDVYGVRSGLAADVWAFATTMWEVYSYGKLPHVNNPQLSATGNEQNSWLSKPEACNADQWKVLTNCWVEADRRLSPQEILRDFTSELHKVYRPSEHFSSQGKENMEVKEILAPLTAKFGSNDEADNESHEIKKLFSSIVYHIGSSSELILDVSANRAGYGHSAQVFRGTLMKGKDVTETVAVKMLRVGPDSNEPSADIQDEINNMKGLNHPNIVPIIAMTNTMIVMPYYRNGSLIKMLKFDNHRIKLKDMLSYAIDIAKGMHYLTVEKKMVHRDLAARNVLVDDEYHIKITDFGLARFTGNTGAYRIRNTNGLLPIDWHAPETVVPMNLDPKDDGKPWLPSFTMESDVWSFGVTMYEMLTYGSPVPPFKGNPLLRAQVLQDQLWGTCKKLQSDPVFRQILEEVVFPCWNNNPEARPTFQKLENACRKLQKISLNQ